MFSNDRILTLDVGASKLVLGEFFVKKGASLVLTKYVVRTLDAGQADAVAPTMESLAGVVREMMAEGGIKAAPLYAMLSGSAVFPRFVKLPPVSFDKIDEMVGEPQRHGSRERQEAGRLHDRAVEVPVRLGRH